MTFRSALPSCLLLFLASGLLAPPPIHAQLPGGAQIEEEDLDESETLAVEVQAPTVADSELQELFTEAVILFQSEDRPASLTLFGHVVDILSAARETTGLEPEDLDLLLQSLTYRAWVHQELGLDDRVQEELDRLVRLDPNADLAGLPLVEPVPEDLLESFQRLRKKTVGEVIFVLDPFDARVLIDGRPVENTGEPVAVLAEPHQVRVERPGYAPVERDLELDAGRSMTLELTLERQSPVLRLNTRPRGAEIRIDGRSYGVTEGTAAEGFLPQGAAALYRREEFSEEMIIEDLEPGLRILQISKEGHRPYRMELVIQELIDYQMPPIVLEPQGGQLVFVDFPRNGQIRIDGEPAEPDVPGVSRPRVSLAPGDYHVTVTAGQTKMFSTRLSLADRQNVEVRVELRPGLSFLGVLGGDRTAAENLRQSFGVALRGSEKWTLIDRSPEAPAVLRELGVDAETLRRGSDEIDWRALQQAVDRQAPGLLYLVAVLDNDLVATEADFWILTAGPGPAQPDRVTVPLSNDPALVELRERLDASLRLRRPYTGMVVIDSNATPHPVVAHVTPGSPAEAADLRPGDEIVGVSGVPVQSRAELENRFLAAESGETLDLVIRSRGVGRNERIELGSSPRLLHAADGYLPSVAYTELLLLEERAGADELWILQLNRALLLLAADDHEAAAKLLRSIRGPQSSHGLNQATVDYFLGLALMRSGTAELRNAARQAFERAARFPGARLHHHDEAFLLPRVRARLHELSGGASPP